MRVPVSIIGKDRVPRVEKFLGEKLRRVKEGTKEEIIVFKQYQWEKFILELDRMEEEGTLNESLSLCETTAVVLRAYNSLMKVYGSAKKTPEGKVALIAAVMSIYTASPSMGKRLTYMLNI